MHTPRDAAFINHVNATYSGQTITVGTLIDAGYDTGLIARHIGIHSADYPTLDDYRAVQIRVFKNPDRRASNG